MTEQEISALAAAINALADATDTLTGTERAGVVRIMQELSDMIPGDHFDIEAWLAYHVAAGAASV